MVILPNCEVSTANNNPIDVRLFLSVITRAVKRSEMLWGLPSFTLLGGDNGLQLFYLVL
jgi:hypothetical protein